MDLPLFVWGPHFGSPGDRCIEELSEFKPRYLPPLPPVQMSIRYVDSAGKQRIKGGRDLKSSQSYPLQFLGEYKVN